MAHFLVRIGEIWLKSRRTRSALVDRLVNNIKSMLERKDLDFSIQTYGPRILVESSDHAIDVLPNVFGVTSVSPGMVVEPTLEQIEYAALKLLDGKRGTFKVVVNRGWKGFPMTSPETERTLGARIPEVKGVPLQVDIHNPDFTLGVDIREKFAFVYTETIQGPGGLPYGSQGHTLTLFSGGLDSPVASWLIAKRGANVDHLFVNTCCENVESKVVEVFDSLSSWYPKTNLYVARVPELAKQIKAEIPEGYRQVVYKVALYTISGLLADKLNSKAIVTGESLGQVSSQTLTNISTINSFSRHTILRPLIGFNKDEIVRIARKIGTYEPSSKVPEFCKLESHSRTNVPKTIAGKMVGKLDFDWNGVEFVKIR